jgi:uncharacterized protein
MSERIQTGARRGFHVLTKPIGPVCNLECSYCFYLEKHNLYPEERQWRMSDAVLEQYIRQYIQEQPGPEILFAWQGGEPTLLGVEFFQKAVQLQRKHAGDRTISNALQTNGTLLDDRWCEFLAEHHFLAGLSVDGPRELHDKHRVAKGGKPTFDAVMRGLGLLKKHGVEFNTLTVVHRANARQAGEVYRFLKEIGSRYLQFIPLVERAALAHSGTPGLDFAEPPDPGRPGGPAGPVTGESVEAEQYGRFLCAIFDQWVRRDVGRVFVQLFDVALGNWMGLGSSLCVFGEKCGAALAMEHNGDLYSCDHYVYPKYRLGNLLNQSLGAMAASPSQREFGGAKFDSLPAYCRQCQVRFACNGECPKHRFIRTPDGQEGLNYLCPAYKRFFNHIDPCMRAMAQLLRNNQAASDIMEMIAEAEARPQSASAGRNDPCPCGSGRKYKKCCWLKTSPIHAP